MSIPLKGGFIEGPSLVIARDEMSAAIGRRVTSVLGIAKVPIIELQGQKLLDIGAWGKHFLLFFNRSTVKVHFLMFGSYRIDVPKENREAKLFLDFGNIRLYFYSCSVQFLRSGEEQAYEWSADIMSPSWDEVSAVKKLRQTPGLMLCDVLLDQNVFSGIGNIIKNEVLFDQCLLPERLVYRLSAQEQKRLVSAVQTYAWNFYEWKKHFEFKKHWQIMRKRTCPNCAGPVTKKVTGLRQRVSHFCTNCQK